MSRRRWWEAGSALDDEVAWFNAEGLTFELDRGVLEANGVVVFRGELRLDRRRVAAKVVYPPSYGTGGHPEVIAPELPVGRHRTSDGRLCLDHAVFGELRPMDGAEAALEDEEADAPDPEANHFEFLASTAVLISDAHVSTGQRGYFTLKASRLEPLRGVVSEVRVTHPAPLTVRPSCSLEGVEGGRAERRMDETG